MTRCAVSIIGFIGLKPGSMVLYQVRYQGVKGEEMEKTSRERVVLGGILFVILVIAYFDRVNTSVLVADNAFLTEMGLKGNPLAIGSLMSMFLGAYAISNAIFGPLGDLLGPRRVMMVSVVIMGASMIIGGLAQSLAILLVARVVLGAGEGMHWPMQAKFVKNWFPPKERGKANSAWLVGLMVAPAVAMPFFTWLIGLVGWRQSFFVLSTMSLISILLLYFRTTDHPNQSKRVDRVELEHIESALKAEAAIENASGATTTWESYKLFLGNYRFWLLVLFYMASASVYWGTIAWLPSYFKVVLGFNWKAMGAWSSLPYALGASALIFAGYMTDRFDVKILFATVSVLIPAVFIYLATTATNMQAAAILISIGIAGVALGLPTCYSILQSLVPGKSLAAGSGIMSAMGMGASTVAPMVIGYFIKTTGQYSSGLMYLVVVALIGSVSVVLLGLTLPKIKEAAVGKIAKNEALERA
jgi:sugar phosphate permease